MRKQQVQLQVPNLLLQLKRWMFAVAISIVWDAFSTLLILGEDVFWKFQLVDQLYSRIGTTTGDTFILVWTLGESLIIGLVILWNLGLLGYIRDWGDANI